MNIKYQLKINLEKRWILLEKVSSIESVVENDIKSNLVKLTLPNKEKLSSGSFAQVYIPNTKREDTLVYI